MTVEPYPKKQAVKQAIRTALCTRKDIYRASVLVRPHNAFDQVSNSFSSIFLSPDLSLLRGYRISELSLTSDLTYPFNDLFLYHFTCLCHSFPIFALEHLPSSLAPCGRP